MNPRFSVIMLMLMHIRLKKKNKIFDLKKKFNMIPYEMEIINWIKCIFQGNN